MMNGFRKWLSFSKGERVAIISILAVIMALVLANVFHHGRKSLSEASLHNLDSLLALRQHALWEQQSKMAEQTQDVAELHPFPFNPNTLTEDEWRQIGLTDRQIRNIMNYQAKGGKFYSKNDLAKLYTISEEDFAQLESFIVLPEVTRRDYKKLNSEVKDYQQVIPPPSKTIPMVDLNRVDSATLVELPQIGGYTATRIVAYREKLGGFLNKEQLLEVKGMDEARYNVVQRYINIGEAEIRKIDVNRADFKALVSHPYLNYNQVKRIVNQREKRGMIKDWEQLNALIAQDEPVNPLLEMYVAF